MAYHRRMRKVGLRSWQNLFVLSLLPALSAAARIALL